MESQSPLSPRLDQPEPETGSGEAVGQDSERLADIVVTPLKIVALAAYHVGWTALTHVNKIAGGAALLFGLLIFGRSIKRLLSRYLVGSWRQLNAEAAELRAADRSDTFDMRPLVVLVTTAVVLTLIEYFGGRDSFGRAARQIAPTLRLHEHYSLMGYAYWSGFRVCAYVLVPWAVVLLQRGERLRDYGLSFEGFFRHLKIYGVLYLIVLPPLVMVSFTEPFQRTYPFYKQAARSWADFLAWEAMYSVQFAALELFFRGFMIHPLKKSLGSHAIFVMAVPYCMIHYSKPLAEVFGAVIAAIVLGTLSLRTRSIWSGVLIHVTVAVTMDVLSLAQIAGYPGNPRYVP